jgi:hypothetical protein
MLFSPTRQDEEPKLNPLFQRKLLLQWGPRRRLVLVVSEVCARGCCSRRVGEGSTRGEERLVGRSAPDAAVGVAGAKKILTMNRKALHRALGLRLPAPETLAPSARK